MPPTRSNGKIAIAITMMPIPPSHCNIARQISIPGGAWSSPVITVDPVVVKPDIASKKASVKLNSSSENRNGKAAKTVNTNQLRVVIIKACRTLRRPPPVRLAKAVATPTNNVTPPDTINTSQSGCSDIKSKTAGTIIINARVDNRIPITKNTGRKSIRNLCATNTRGCL